MDVEEANKFINSLVKNLQVLCHGHVTFDSSIQVIGHLYLNVDSQTNIDYIVNEKVCKSDNSSTMFVSKSYHSEPAQKKEKKNPEKNPNRERRSSSQSDTSNDDQNQRNERLGFSSNYGDTHHPHRPQKTSTPTHGMRRPLHHNMEGPALKMPRMSHPQSPMSPSSTGSRNSSHPGLRLDNRNVMGDNSSHQFDLSRLQQSNISETSFHLQPHISSNNLQRNTSSSSPSKTVPAVKQEPVQIDLSSVKSEPYDDDGGTEDMGNEMSNEEFLASLHDKTTSSIYPVALHSNETSASSSQQLDFNLPISFQQGAGGAGPSFAPDGSAVPRSNGEANTNEWIQNYVAPRSRMFISRTEKRQLCLIHEANPDYNIDDICKEFAKRFGKVLRQATVYYIMKTKEKWLKDDSSEISI